MLAAQKNVLIVMVLAFGSFLARSADKEKKTVEILQLVEHVALNKVKDAAISVLKSSPYKDSLNIRVHNANGDLAIAAQIAKQIVNAKPNVAFGIATPSAQMLLQNSKTTPIVFAPISDPVGAKLVKSNAQPQTWATGVSDAIDMKKSFELMREIKPALKKVGFIFNPGEKNSISQMNDATVACAALDLTLVKLPVKDVATVALVTRSLKGIDFLYAPLDNTVASALGTIVANAHKQLVPVFGADLESVSFGALVAKGVDYSELGALAGEQMVAILSGKAPQEIPVAFGQKQIVLLSKKAQDDLKIKIPESVAKIANFL